MHAMHQEDAQVSKQWVFANFMSKILMMRTKNYHWLYFVLVGKGSLFFRKK